ncbi:WS/DGAT/MGAT family O-acyltransferase [Congregibacter sp.]|uniref:WS/DGAT/MGAT family O-acyltransferase n=1 Tax=Congregibacter sp. TaxID=2744308 RepID=UPI003858D99F
MKKLSMVDKGFLLGESREMPMHVSGVSLFTLPDGAEVQEFLAGIADNLKDADALLPPFGDRIKTGRLGVAGNVYWEPDPSMDLDYHIRHSALPSPGRYRELFNLVGRLHGTLLERSRPLWEMHLIEGLQNRQFAIFTKTHHAAVDGARSIHVTRSMLSSDPDAVRSESPLSLASWESYRKALREGRQAEYTDAEVRTVADILKSTYGSGANAFNALKNIAGALAGRKSDLSIPHHKVPRSALNGKIDAARRFVAQTWSFARIRAVGKAFDATFNDTVLAMCAGGLRQYMLNHSELPKDSMKTLVPVSLRQAGDVDSGNAVAGITADLGTNIADPIKRFSAIKASVEAGKANYAGMSPKEVELLTMAMSAPSMLLMPLGMISHLPPYNLTISNVPGMRETMYWNGARMDGSYPLSIITDGMALNITLVSYADQVDFGIIACRRSVPQVQRLIDYMEDALQELEDAVGLKAKPSRRRAAVKTKIKTKTKTKTKAKPKAKISAAAKAKPKAKSTTTAKAKPRAKAKPKPKAKG